LRLNTVVTPNQLFVATSLDFGKRQSRPTQAAQYLHSLSFVAVYITTISARLRIVLQQLDSVSALRHDTYSYIHSIALALRQTTFKHSYYTFVVPVILTSRNVSNKGGLGLVQS